MTLGGLLKHLAWVEELYFQHRLAGRASMSPFDALDLERDWDDWAWATAADDTPDALRALWAEAVHRSRASLTEALSRGGLDQTTHDGMSLRRLLADMIEEYARHTGHADLLREHVDGATGEGAPRTSRCPEPHGSESATAHRRWRRPYRRDPPANGCDDDGNGQMSPRGQPW